MGASARRVEREAKFDAGDGVVLAPVDGMQVLSDDTVTLLAEYWDTPDLRLLAWGHTVRYRASSDGEEAGWTVKFGEAAGKRGVLQRDEIEVAGEAQSPPAEVRNLVGAFTGHQPLVPLATLTTVRHRVRLRRNEGSSVEVTDDDVTSDRGGRPGPPLHEVEVELIDGDAAAVDEVAAELRRRGVGKRVSMPKIARVVQDELADAPPRLKRRQLTHSSTTADLVKAAITDGTLRLLARDPGLRLGDDPEDIHQARVATRRLRSDLKTLEPLLLEARVQAVRAELRWLGQLLGAVRDVDVLMTHLHDEGDTLADGDVTGTAGLLERLRMERALRLLELRDVLDSERYRDLTTELIEMSREPPFRPGAHRQTRADKTGRRVAKQAWRRTARRVRRLGAQPPDADLHEIRRRAKRARYAAELVEPVTRGAKPRTLATRLSAIQDTLGELQDSVVADQWLRREVRSGLDSAEAFTAGLLLAKHADVRRSMRGRWRRDWERASKAQPNRWPKKR